MSRELPETPGTTPISLVFQLLEAERMIHEEGLEAVFDRHTAMATRARERALELGYSLAGSAIKERSPTLTALTVPDGVDPESIRKHVLEAGIQIAGGLGEFKSNTVRIGHMGDIRISDVDRTLDAMTGI
jgi:aspartate aminotransferase-like enzyme